MGHPGMGVMLGMLGGNKDTVEAVRGSLNKVIASAELRDDRLRIALADGTTMQ